MNAATEAAQPKEARTEETPRARGIRRLLSTASLLRGAARDQDEAAFYLSEERRLARLLKPRA